MTATAGAKRSFLPEHRAKGLNFAIVESYGIIEMVGPLGEPMAHIAATATELSGLIEKMIEMREFLRAGATGSQQ